MTEIEEPSTGEDKMNSAPLSSNSSAPKTPVPIKLASAKPNSAFNTDEMDLKTYLSHISLWRQPLLTAKYLLFISILFYSTCEGGYSYASFFLTALVYRTLLVSAPLLVSKQLETTHSSFSTALNKLGTLLSEQLPLPTEADITFWVTGLSDFVETKLSLAVKALKQSETDFRLFKVVITNCVSAMLVLWLFSPRTLVFVVAFWFLLWPVTYAKFHESVDKVVELTVEKSKPFLDKMTDTGKQLSEKVLHTSNETFETVKTKYEEFRKKTAEKTEKAKKA